MCGYSNVAQTEQIVSPVRTPTEHPLYMQHVDVKPP